MKYLLKIIFICSLLGSTTIHAQQMNIKLFAKDSYQQILNEYKQQPLILILWSVTCSSCLSEMKLIQQIHQQKPKLNIIMLSVDGPEFHQEMAEIISQKKLTEIEHWGFSEDNSPALRYAIDSRWYGELPRTYFFDSQHNKTGISGALSQQIFNENIALIK